MFKRDTNIRDSMRILSFTFIISLLLSGSPSNAQIDSVAFDVIGNEPVIINGATYDDGIQGNIFNQKELDRYRANSLSEILKRESGIFIKEYGAGLLATATHRGGSAAQTAVIWEGLNILNPMLGQADLNLMPLAFTDQLSWQSGGNSALNGNNSIGGTVKISSGTDFNIGLKTMGLFQIGSFGDFRQQFSIKYGNSNYAGSIRAFYQKAENDYNFRDVNAFGNPKPMKKLIHAAQESWGLMQENKLKFANGNLSFKHWYQQAYRQIPPNMLQTVGDKEEQWDAFFRNLICWNQNLGNSILKIEAAYIYEKLQYQNIVLLALSRIHNSLLRISQTISLGENSSFNWLLEEQYQFAVSDNYNKGQNLLSAAISVKIYKKSWVLNFNAREMLADNTFLLPAIAANFSYNFKNKLIRSFKSSVSHNYRFPTLNDRYWPVGGNPNLKPEYSWSADAQIHLEKKFSLFNVNFDLGAYFNDVRDWIQWSPGNFGLWEPQNLYRVRGFGPETKINIEKSIGLHHIEFSGSYQMNRARRIMEIDPGLQNKQLIYSPEHSISSGFGWNYNNCFSLLYRHNFFSRRYLDNSNQNWLPSYHTAYFRMDWNLKFKKTDLSFFGILDNIWNSAYQAVANRPMPGRSVNIGIIIRG
jgi:vitamin B12 transporter